MGCYLLLTLKDRSSIADKESIQVEFIRFAYDVEKATEAMENSPLPEDLADKLRKAF